MFQIKHKKQLVQPKKWEQLFYNAGNDVIVAVFVLPRPLNKTLLYYSGRMPVKSAVSNFHISPGKSQLPT